MTSPKPTEPLAKTYFCLTALFIVSVIVAIVSLVTLASFFAYGLLPGASDRGPSHGLIQDHRTVVLVAAVSVGLAVVVGCTLAILDRVLDR